MKLYPPIKLTDSYLKDDRGETMLGQDAEVLRRLKQDQEALGNWGGTKEEALEYSQKPIQRKRKKNPNFIERDKALEEFNQMNSGDDDEYH
jgi:hypothetical protein